MSESLDGRRRKKDFEGSRRDFQRAAFELLAEKGYHLTSVDDIAERAGRSKGGFYHHYQTKNDIYTELFDQILTQASQRIHDGLQSGRSAKQVLLDLLAQSQGAMADKRFLQAAVDFFLMALRQEDARSLLRVLRDRSVAMFETFFKEGIAKGDIDPGIDAHRTAEVLFGSSRGLMILSTILDDGRSLAEQLRVFVDMMFDGLTNGSAKTSAAGDGPHSH